MQHTFFVQSFLCRCFARRQRETSRNFLVTRFMEEMLYVVLFTFFSLPLIFTLVAASISHFLTAAKKCSCYSSNEIGLLCFLISGSSSFSVIHANVDFKIKSKQKNRLRCCCFLSLRVQVARRFTAETRGYLNCKISPGLHEGMDVPSDVLRTDDFLRTKISWMHSLPNFLNTHGVPRALRYYETLFFITQTSDKICSSYAST